MKNWLEVASVVLATTAMVAGCYSIVVNGQEATPTKPSAQKVTTTQPVKDEPVAQDQPKADALNGHPPHDYLWLLNYEDKTKLSGEFQQMLRRLADSKVPTIEAANQVALSHKFKVLGGLLAEESVDVVGLVRIGVDVPDFAGKGDLIWDVRISHTFEGVTQEMWISSTTGEVKYIFPPTGE